jgi:hypothetical protein
VSGKQVVKARGGGIEKQPERKSEGGVGGKRIREGGSEFLRTVDLERWATIDGDRHGV